MSRWIDADALPRHGQRGGVVHWKDIEEAPSIDIIRCKDCKYLAVESEDEGTSWYYCTPNGHEVDETDFCSWGK